MNFDEYTAAVSLSTTEPYPPLTTPIYSLVIDVHTYSSSTKQKTKVFHASRHHVTLCDSKSGKSAHVRHAAATLTSRQMPPLNFTCTLSKGPSTSISTPTSGVHTHWFASSLKIGYIKNNVDAIAMYEGKGRYARGGGRNKLMH